MPAEDGSVFLGETAIGGAVPPRMSGIKISTFMPGFAPVIRGPGGPSTAPISDSSRTGAVFDILTDAEKREQDDLIAAVLNHRFETEFPPINSPDPHIPPVIDPRSKYRVTFPPGAGNAARVTAIQDGLAVLGFDPAQFVGGWGSKTQTCLSYALFGMMSEEDLVAMTIWTEASAEGLGLMNWVAAVIRNRFDWKADSWTHIVLSGLHFSGWNRGIPGLTELLKVRKAIMERRADIEHPPASVDTPSWKNAFLAAKRAIGDFELPAFSSTATHFYDTSVAMPPWAAGQTPIKSIPTHGGTQHTLFFAGKGVPGMGITIYVPKRIW